MRTMLAVLPLALCLTGCQSLALSMAGAGASAALGASLAGISYRTFTAPLAVVKKASMAALENMGMTPESFGRFEAGEIIFARASGRSVEIELEALTPRATRMRVSTRDGSLFYDGATASEIVVQTQKVLEAAPATELARDAKRISVTD
jgi:Protein of unknown function (DUF3568)